MALYGPQATESLVRRTREQTPNVPDTLQGLNEILKEERLPSLPELEKTYKGYVKVVVKNKVTKKHEMQDSILFFHDDIKSQLENAECLFVDGLFKVRSYRKKYTQYFTEKKK